MQGGFKRVMLGQDSQKAWYAKRSQPVEHSQEADPGAFFGFSGDVGNQGVGFTVKDAAAQTYAYDGDLKERDAFENISPSNPDNTMMQLGTNNALCPKRSAIGPKINEPASMPMGRKVTSDVVCSPLNSSFVTREGSTEPNVIIETPKNTFRCTLP